MLSLRGFLGEDHPANTVCIGAHEPEGVQKRQKLFGFAYAPSSEAITGPNVASTHVSTLALRPQMHHKYSRVRSWCTLLDTALF